MYREVFSKKTLAPYHLSLQDDSEGTPRPIQRLTKKLTGFYPNPNVLTPKKSDQKTPPDEDDNLAASNFSEWDRYCFERQSPKEERDISYMSVAENISYFIDSHSSGKSDVSFRSDLARPDRFNSSSTNYEK
jgi:hypothetical protein